MMPMPNFINKTITCDVDLETDRFWVKDEDGDEIQIRIEKKGTIYLCYTTGNRSVIEAREVSWDEFKTAFRKFVDDFGSEELG